MSVKTVVVVSTENNDSNSSSSSGSSSGSSNSSRNNSSSSGIEILIIRKIRATISQGRLHQLAPRRRSGTRHRPRRALGAAIPTDGVATNTRHRVSVI